MRKKGKPEVLVRSMISLYDGAKTKFMVDSELSDELEIKWGCTKNLRCQLFSGRCRVTEFAKGCTK